MWPQFYDSFGLSGTQGTQMRSSWGCRQRGSRVSELIPSVGPKDNINMKILHASSEAHDKVDARHDGIR